MDPKLNDAKTREIFEKEYERMLNESDTADEDEMSLGKITDFILTTFGERNVSEVAFLLAKVHHVFLRTFERFELL